MTPKLALLCKSSINAANKGLAIGYAGRGFCVDGVSPGIIKTTMHASESYDAKGALRPTAKRVKSLISLRRSAPLSSRL